MSERRARLGIGLGGGLAVSLPAVLLAQILDAVSSDELPVVVTVPLGIAALAGAVVGGWLVGRRPGAGHPLVAGTVGAIVLTLVAGLGLLRRTAGGDDAEPLAVVALAVCGAVLGLIGNVVGTRSAARTRP